MTLSEEERKRRSEAAKALHQQTVVDPETGEERPKFGGAQPGSGRPRKKRASEVVAEQVAEEGQAIYDRLMGIVKDGPNIQAISAARTLLDVEERERALEEREQVRFEDMERAQLVGWILTKLEELKDAGVIGDAALDGIVVEGEVVGAGREEPVRAGEGLAGPLALGAGD